MLLSASADNANNGWMGIYDAAGTSQAGFFINGQGQGVLFADVTSAPMDHPSDEQMEIIYTAITGPEAAAYDRGTAKLINGEVFISLGGHYRHMASGEKMTVMVVPLSADSKGLAVIEKTKEGFRVKELHGGTGNYKFDWEVKDVRDGYQQYLPVQRKKPTREKE